MSSRVLLSSLLSLVTATLCLASVEVPMVAVPGSSQALAEHEGQLGKLSVHNSNFSAMGRTSSRSSCEAVQPPEALATPAPMLDRPGLNTSVTVSFIVGTDGRVHSPLILEGLGPAEDRIVLDTLLSWRYRPATCNGVPTEAEGKIAISSR